MTFDDPALPFHIMRQIAKVNAGATADEAQRVKVFLQVHLRADAAVSRASFSNIKNGQPLTRSTTKKTK